MIRDRRDSSIAKTGISNSGLGGSPSHHLGATLAGILLYPWHSVDNYCLGIWALKVAMSDTTSTYYVV